MPHSNDLLRAARQSIRDEILCHPGIQAAMNWARQRGAPFFPGGGNLGDGLIGLGAQDLFDHFDLRPEVRLGWHTDVLQGARHLVVNGNGGMAEGLWRDFTRVLQPFFEAGGEAVLLPCTVSGYHEFFSRFGKQITVFARERTTYEHLQAIDSLAGRVHLCHDLAFAVDYGRTGWPEGLNGSEASLSLLRSDEESRGHAKPRDNIDLALVWNGIQWSDRATCMPPLTAAAQLIHQFDEIRSDRLHMSILAALMGKRVTMLPNAYFKNRAVYDHTLHRFAHVRFSDEVPSGQMLSEEKNVWVSLTESRLDRDQLHQQLAEANSKLESSSLLLAQRDQQLMEARDELHRSLLKLGGLQARILDISRNCDAPQQWGNAPRTRFPDPDFRNSRAYRLWLWYLRLYERPVVGPALRLLRKLIKPVVLLRRRWRGRPSR